VATRPDAGVRFADARAGVSDTGADGATVTSQADGGLLPHFLDGWVQAPWAGNCEIYEPSSPATLATVPQLQWKACASGQSGCQDLAQTWSPSSTAETHDWSIAKSPSGATRVAFSRIYVANSNASVYQEEYVIWDSDRGVVDAWRHEGDDSCLAVGIGDVTAGSVVFTVAAQVPTQKIARYMQIVGDASDLSTRTSPDYTFCDQDLGFGACPSVLFMSSTAASPKLSVMGYDQADRLFIRDRASGRIDPLRLAGTDAGGRTISGNYSIVDDAVFYSDGRTAYVWTLGVGERVLVAPAAGVSVHDVAADGTYVAWVESSSPDPSGSFKSSTLYASAYTTDGATLQRRVLLDQVCPTGWCDARVEDGYVLVGTWAQGATSASTAVIRVSDGERWTVPQTGGDRWDTGFESGGELWIPYSSSDPAVRFSLRRLAISALGPGSDR
jgi:hypothetical protein